MEILEVMNSDIYCSNGIFKYDYNTAGRGVVGGEMKRSRGKRTRDAIRYYDWW